MKRLYSFCVFMGCYISVFSDIYLHTPRGSNNRLNENTRNRKNANRMFDSQNNNRGGYNVGPQPMYYYTGSKLQIEWTNQHSCADKNNNCELIIQYMCGNNLRDGTTTDTIKLKKNECANENCNTDTQYGMHENYDYYWQCKLRKRNMGLFTADQDMGGRNRKTAVSTRQENNGNNKRYGYECTEERDYYPYWHPSPWKDIAVLTNNAERCKFYQLESANVKERWYCYIPVDKLEEMDAKNVQVPNTKADCESFTYPETNGVKGIWRSYPAHGIAAPECRETQFTRDNHLGNGLDGNPNRYNWTVPDIQQAKCALRIRYNISTNDYDGWKTNSSVNSDNKDTPTKLDLSKKYGFDNNNAAKDRGYVFEGDPAVKIFDEGNFDFQLAVDTSQFGRTFQDRSHVFAIKKRPNNLNGVEIHNINVRGKRGNIVQVYPAVEYDFVPNVLEMNPEQYVHFQWNGADTNPQNNDGEGKKGSDRNNVLLLRNKNYPEGNGVQYGPAPTYGHYGNNYPANIGDSEFLGLGNVDLKKLAFIEPGKAGLGANLDEASPYFDLGPKKVTQLGTYHYVCTRNNNFSNRDQKARIMVTNMAFTENVLGSQGGKVTLPNNVGTVQIPAGAFDSLHMVRIEVWPRAQGHQKVKDAGKVLKAGDEYVSDFVVIYPQSSLTVPGKDMSVTLKIDSDASNVAIYRSSSDNNFVTWTKVDTQRDGDVVHCKATSGGVYVARSHSHTVLIVALVISLSVLALIIVGGVWYCRRNKINFKKLKADGQRNFSGAV